MQKLTTFLRIVPTKPMSPRSPPWRLRSRRNRMSLPVSTGSCNGIHLGADLVEEPPRVLAHAVEIEMRAPGQISEVRVCAETSKHRFELVRRAVEVEGVRGANEEMNASFEIRLELRPVSFDDVGEVIVIVPVGDDRRINVPSNAVEHLPRSAA